MIKTTVSYLTTYTVAAIVNLFSVGLSIWWLEVLSKSLLMPVLILCVVKRSQGLSVGNWLVAALVFCWLGDLALLFTGMFDSAFISGLLFFLTGHCLYSWINFMDRSSSNLTLKVLFAVSLIILAIFYFYFISSHLGEMLIPVAIYTAIISCMVISAAFRHPRKGSSMVLTGAMLFMLSDSLIAYGRFVNNFPFDGILIMATYITAQLIMVRGYQGAQSTP